MTTLTELNSPGLSEGGRPGEIQRGLLPDIVLHKHGGKISLLLRLLALIGLLWTGKQALKQVASLLHPHSSDHEGSTDDDEIVKDPVCLTYIPKSLAVQKRFNEKTWYFCSKECADKFKEEQTE